MSCILVRHTRLQGSEGLCYGHHELNVAETFPVEADAVAAALGWTPEVIWTSPACRCVDLAKHLARGCPIRTDERLRELHFGEWEGRRWDELNGPAVEEWMRDPWRARPPGGETAGELLARVREARKRILDASAAPLRTLVVTHGGVIRAWLALERGTSLADQFNTPIPHGTVLRVGDHRA